MLRWHRLLGVAAALALLVGALPLATATAGTGDSKRYIVVFDGGYAVDGSYAVESTYAVLCNYAVSSGYAVTHGYAVDCNYAVDENYAVEDNYAVYAVYAVAHDYAVYAVTAAGGTVASDLLKQTGVLIVDSTNPLFADVMGGYAVVEEVGQDYSWAGVPSGSAPTPVADPLEAAQWSMAQIQAPAAHAIQPGWSKVDVGILDSGVDALHLDLRNVACERGRNFIPDGPGIGNPSPCIDNGFHGTHVAGIVAAQQNGHGVVGVAPGVTLVPVKVCDSAGYCYASSVVNGITYAGDAKLDVINMSFFVDDGALLESTEFKCSNDPAQRAFRRAVERAVQYARGQGVTPVAALGNSDSDLAANSDCDTVPAETSGVIGTMALGANSQKASYSSYGNGATDVAAPGGSGQTGNCLNTVLSTLPGNVWGCIQGTSMASPHAAGVAALIESQFGTLGADDDVKLSPTTVEAYLQASTVDIGLKGYDECFGNGRINALRAVKHDTSSAYDDKAPFCPEYRE